MLECAEQRGVYLDDPASKYGVSLPETSRNRPGDSEPYVRGTSGRPLPVRPGSLRASSPTSSKPAFRSPIRKTVAVRLLERFAMKDSRARARRSGGRVVAETLFAASVQDRYKDVLDRIAVPYKVDKKGRSSRSEHPDREHDGGDRSCLDGPGPGSTLDAALDSATCFFARTTLTAAWTNAMGRDRMLPYGPGLVRPELQRRSDRLAIRRDDRRLFVADS